MTMKILLTALLTVLAMLAVGAGMIHGGGLTNFAADEPHAELIDGVIEFTRERFIAARSAELEVPALDDPRTIADGAEHYLAMCSGCHLGPGVPDTELRRGMYPQPPDLARPAGHAGGHDHSDPRQAAKRQFWIIKHGIKMTGMPAWGVTHDDQAVWSLVAFLQKLPTLSPEEFAALGETRKSKPAHKDDGHAH
jgi:mono/diheme cytochrome c family protein